MKLPSTHYLISQLWIFLQLFETISPIEFIVEEPQNLTTSRHLHRIRKHRQTKSLPYISAASTLKNTYSNQYDAFSLNCPHVADSGSDDVKIEVTWTLNETVWLKIEDGEKKVSNRLTSINRRKVGGKTVLRIMLNNGRYMFDYDELTGDFSMEIRPVEIREDMGIWQCHVTVYQKGNTHILTSRSRVKSPNSIATDPPQMHSHSSEVLLKPPTSREAIPLRRDPRRPNPDFQKFSTFTRPEGGMVQISRDSDRRPNAIVFARQDPLRIGNHNRDTEIDYEMDLNPAAPYYDLDLPYYDPSSRSYARSAFFNNSPSKFLAKSYLVTFAVSLYCIMLL